MTGEASAADFDRWLAYCRQRLGDPPRRVGLWARLFHLWLPPPPGLGFHDDLTQLFYRRAELLRTGPVVWGHVVRADDPLLRPGLGNHYATVVFGTLPGSEPPLPRLREMAAALATRDEYAGPAGRACGVPVPPDLAGRCPCAVSTLWVVRRHLPGRELLRPYLPLIVLPDPPHLAMVLPARYWPADLVEHWCQPPL